MSRAETDSVGAMKYPDREWWQTCSGEDLKSKMLDMDLPTLKGLHQRMRGSITMIQSVIETTDDEDRRRRARQALGFISEKRRMVGGRISEIEVGRAETSTMGADLRASAIERGRKALERLDLIGAIRCLFDWMEAQS